MNVDYFRENMVSIDISESTSIANLHFDPCLQYKYLAARVFVTFKSNEDLCYVYEIEDKAALLFQALTEKSAGRFAVWTKAQAADSPRKMFRAKDGSWVISPLLV
jgi:hypothetical protein